MPNDSRDRALNLVRMKGPLLPGHINKDLNVNVLFASAMLSELVDSKLIRLSHAKIGGSPVYYAPGQESRLEQVLFPYLNEKDKEVLKLLKQRCVLKDTDLTPLQRVSLRGGLRDFAVPLEVVLEGGSVLFWKWLLLPDSDAENFIKAMLKMQDKKVEPKVDIPVVKMEVELPKKELPRQMEHRREEHIRPISEFSKPEPRIEAKVEKKVKIEEPTKVEVPLALVEDAFLDKIRKYFKDHDIGIKSYSLVKKGAEFDFIIEVPSAVGNMEWYCKAKKKKSYNEADITSAFVQGQLKKLPVLLLTTGEITKKAKTTLEKDFKGVHIKRI